MLQKQQTLEITAEPPSDVHVVPTVQYQGSNKYIIPERH